MNDEKNLIYGNCPWDAFNKRGSFGREHRGDGVADAERSSDKRKRDDRADAGRCIAKIL